MVTAIALELLAGADVVLHPSSVWRVLSPMVFVHATLLIRAALLAVSWPGSATLYRLTMID